MAGKRSCDITIPLDITVEILKILPAKSLARFQCVSKQWASIIREFIVIDSIVTRSLTQPSRDPHFIFYRRSKCNSFSILLYVHPHQITNQEQLYHEEICGKSNGIDTRCQYVRGLVGFWSSSYCAQFTIYNPTTRQTVSLPRLPPSLFYLFGYDPLKNQYKVVCLTKQKYPPKKLSCQVFTLGDPNKEWMNIQCGIGSHFPLGNAVCINGAVYYKARKMNPNRSYVLLSFDVRSHKFNHVQAPDNMTFFHRDATLINYQGKLACICRNNIINEDVDMWVMENAEKQEWSKITFFGILQGLTSRIRFAKVTHPRGEVVILHQGSDANVYYYDPKRNSRRRVEIQTTTSSERIRPSDFFIMWAVTDHVENTMCL